MSVARDILLDTSTHDILVQGQDLQLVADLPAIGQSVDIRLLFLLGEWFLDTTVGLPLFQQILVKNPNPAILNSLYTAEILKAPGVTAVPQLTLNYNRNARTLSGSFEATTDLGLLTGTV